ncbi:hypothetical protein GCM10025784_04990 [Citricoccus nitrophenolicus]
MTTSVKELERVWSETRGEPWLAMEDCLPCGLRLENGTDPDGSGQVKPTTDRLGPGATQLTLQVLGVESFQAGAAPPPFRVAPALSCPPAVVSVSLCGPHGA